MTAHFPTLNKEKPQWGWMIDELYRLMSPKWQSDQLLCRCANVAPAVCLLERIKFIKPLFPDITRFPFNLTWARDLKTTVFCTSARVCCAGSIIHTEKSALPLFAALIQYNFLDFPYLDSSLCYTQYNLLCCHSQSKVLSHSDGCL